MLYIVEFAVVCLIVMGVVLWAISLLSPVLCALLFVALAVYLLRNDGAWPLAITGGTLAVLLAISHLVG
jgi:hypothetical protein